MKLLKDSLIWTEYGFKRKDVYINEKSSLSFSAPAEGGEISVFKNCIIIPGLADVHVHLREPGFFYKESIETGTKAAARGGYTDICAMPNLNPVPDSLENLKPELTAIKNSAVVNVYPYGALTKGENGKELSDMEEISPYIIAFSDDGKGVQNPELMKTAMLKAKKLGKIIAAHCEDERLLCGGCIHEGAYAKDHGYKGISSESEWKMVERDLALVKETGVSYHVCHVSTKESVELIRKAKADGLNVSCETAPHYLLLSENDLRDSGDYKMNPPLRSKEDKEALIEGIIDGTVDMIATDHAPHSESEKSAGLQGSKFGIVGLETAFPLMYTYFVKKGIISLEKLIALMSLNPKKRFGIKSGFDKNYAVFYADGDYRIDPDGFLSKGRSTPFKDMKVKCKCILTVRNGGEAWKENLTEN